MSGSLDQISEAIGHLRGSMQAIDRVITQHCDDDDRRHSENLATMRGIKDSLDHLTESVGPLAAAVAKMQPQFDKWQRLGWRLSGMVGLGAVIVAGLIWIAEQAAGAALRWFMQGRGGV